MADCLCDIVEKPCQISRHSLRGAQCRSRRARAAWDRIETACTDPIHNTRSRLGSCRIRKRLIRLLETFSGYGMMRTTIRPINLSTTSSSLIERKPTTHPLDRTSLVKAYASGSISLHVGSPLMLIGDASAKGQSQCLRFWMSDLQMAFKIKMGIFSPTWDDELEMVVPGDDAL